MGTVFANTLGEHGSIHDQVIQKIVLDTPCFHLALEDTYQE